MEEFLNLDIIQEPSTRPQRSISYVIHFDWDVRLSRENGNLPSIVMGRRRRRSVSSSSDLKDTVSHILWFGKCILMGSVFSCEHGENMNLLVLHD